LKATKVDGIYDSDPIVNSKAKKVDNVTYLDVLKQQLKVMDSTAISLAMDNRLPVIVFNLREKGNLRRVVCGENVGTRIKEASHDD
jgi:uridylate kinase